MPAKAAKALSAKLLDYSIISGDGHKIHMVWGMRNVLQTHENRHHSQNIVGLQSNVWRCVATFEVALLSTLPGRKHSAAKTAFWVLYV